MTAPVCSGVQCHQLKATPSAISDCNPAWIVTLSWRAQPMIARMDLPPLAPPPSYAGFWTRARTEDDRWIAGTRSVRFCSGMGLGRDALLWASRNPSLRRRVPRLWFVRRAVLKFMPGETLPSALQAAREFAGRGLPTTFTYLGENVSTDAEAEAVVLHYLQVLDEVARMGLDTEISVKPTHLGLDLDADLAWRNLRWLIRAAGDHKNWVWIDMESNQYVDGTLDLYRRALGTSGDVGVCLQAYLHRTARDLDELVPLNASIRLVKGAYREPADVAVQKKASIDQNYLRLSERLMAARRQGQVRRFAAATHDLTVLSRIEDLARQADLSSKDEYEVQMLYGIRQADQFRLAASGRPTRCLIAYGPAWYPWYMRRLAERPANIGFVIRNAFGRRPVTGTDPGSKA
jgi:proline dehydrogenase